MALFWLFILFPLVEIWVLIEVGEVIGAWWTIVLIVLTAVLGTTVMRWQGMAALDDLRDSFDRFRDPARPMAHGAMILMAGLLLFVPGFVTDAMGALLLIPAFRDWLIRRMARRVVVVRKGGAGRPAGDWPRGDDPGGRVIDVEFEEVDEADASDPATPSRPASRGASRGSSRPPSGWTRR